MWDSSLKQKALIRCCQAAWKDGMLVPKKVISMEIPTLLPLFGKNNKTVRVLSKNSNPRNVLETSHRISRDVVQINQPENVNLYNKNMNAVDWHDQLQLQYPVGQFGKKSWKYLLWFLVNASIVNVYILYQKTSTRPTKLRYSHLDFCWDVVLGLIAGFSSHKCKAEAPAYVGPFMPVNEATHDSVHMGLKQNKEMQMALHAKNG